MATQKKFNKAIQIIEYKKNVELTEEQKDKLMEMSDEELDKKLFNISATWTRDKIIEKLFD